MPPATRIPHGCLARACHAGRVPRPPKETFLLMVPGAIASRLPLAPGTAPTGAGWWARRGGPGTCGCVDARGTGNGGRECMVSPRAHVAVGAPRRGGIHAARDSHPARMPGPAFMPPAPRIPHGCLARHFTAMSAGRHSCRSPFGMSRGPRPASPRRGGIHAARDPHPARTPGRHSCRPRFASRTNAGTAWDARPRWHFAATPG